MLNWAFGCLFLILGAALQLRQTQLGDAWIYGLVLLICAVGTAGAALFLGAFKKNFIHTALAQILLCCAAAGLGWALTGARAAYFQSQALDEALQGVDLQVTGVIAAMPQRDEAALRFRLDVESARFADTASPSEIRLPQRIQLAWYRVMPTVNLSPQMTDQDAELAPRSFAMGLPQAGERWQFLVRLKAPHGNVNPHGFDYELWLWSQGVQATGYVRDISRNAASKYPAGMNQRIGQTHAHPIEAFRQSIRDAIFSRAFPAGLAGIIAALCLGDQASIERADWDVFRATGVAHLMSISGLHITMFAWLAALLVGQLWRRSSHGMAICPAQSAALWGGVLAALSYSLFAGWGVPAQRTVLMLATVSALRGSGRRWPWGMVWLLACAVIVAFDPWALLSAGFWLSFVAVGLLFASDRGQTQALAHSQKSRILQRIQGFLREQWVMSLALAPLSLLLFQQVSIVGLIANLLAIPWVTLVVTPLSLLGMLWSGFWEAAAWSVQVLGIALQHLADFSFATFSIAAPAVSTAIFACLGAIFLVMRWPVPLRMMGACMMLPLLLTQAPRPAHSEFSILAADIGQGNAVLVQTARHSLLYDAGPRFSSESDAGQRTIVPLLRALGIELDMLLISHADSDHSGGAVSIAKMQKKAHLLSSMDDEELNALRKVERCTQGQSWQWDGVQFEILHPKSDDYETAQKTNAMSCVLRISNGRQTALLTGDLEAAQELRLVREGADLKADLLLVPHHGSKTSSSPAFLDAVQPSWAVVQAGYRNRFQHPAAAVMQRYEERKIRIIQSPACGAALWQSDQADDMRCERILNRRYWHHQMFEK